jgi:hypothetical protein
VRANISSTLCWIGSARCLNKSEPFSKEDGRWEREHHTRSVSHACWASLSKQGLRSESHPYSRWRETWRRPIEWQPLDPPLPASEQVTKTSRTYRVWTLVLLASASPTLERGRMVPLIVLFRDDELDRRLEQFKIPNQDYIYLTHGWLYAELSKQIHQHAGATHHTRTRKYRTLCTIDEKNTTTVEH